MQIGGFVVVVEGGPEPEEYELIGTAGHPGIGEQLVVDGSVYVVTRVRHEEDLEARTIARYAFPRVFVRVADDGGRSAPPDADPLTVLPFVPPPQGTARTAAVLPPSLVAVLVAVGYAEQKVSYRVGSRHLAQLRRCGDRWMSLTAADLWRLSRQAKRYMWEATALACELVDEELIWPCSGAALPPEPLPWSVLQGSPLDVSPLRRSKRPALRLV